MSRRTPPPAHVSRELLETDGLAAILARDAPELRILSEEERRRSLDRTLATRPAGRLWLFAYGSLIWNPTIHSVERRVARVEDWPRSFCLSTVAGRGSLECPGLVLALDEGGFCDGIALRIEESEVRAELELLWRREMVTGAYVPRWVQLRDRAGVPFASALTFTINRASPQYTGALERETIVARLAHAAGSLGSAAEYLFRTRDALRTAGVDDEQMERIAIQVERAMSTPVASC